MSPPWALFIGLLTVGGLVVLFWPDRGLFWNWQLVHRRTARVLVEDALKHLFECAYQGHSPTLQSVAGALGLGVHRASEVVEQMAKKKLIETLDGTFQLTTEGRRYALKVIRIHRLWERYLSDETGLAPERWHSHAEQLEHRTSPEEAEALSALLAHPRYDPHGDPIPTPAGEIAPRQGKPLTDLELGDLAEIVHIEDEPPEIYAQLMAEDLHPGMRVRLLDATAERVQFEADAEEHVLAPILAANLSVAPLPEHEQMAGPFERLSALEIGQEARVRGFLPFCRGAERRRLLDLGLIPGTQVQAELKSPSGDPVGYRIRGAVIALRKSQADQIQIERAS